MINDFASPMFARWLNSLTLLISFAPAALPPLMPKPTIAALPVGQILLYVGMVGMAGQAGIIHPRHRRMFREELGHGQGVLRVPLHPQVQRLQAQQRQERPERTLARPRVAEPMRADVEDVGDVADRPQRFFEDHAVIGRVGGGEFRPFLRLVGPGNLPLSTIAPPRWTPWPARNFVVE